MEKIKSLEPIYISGGMSFRRYSDWNYPEFNKVSKRLRSEGYKVINPAENFDGRSDHPCGREGYMKLDISHVLGAGSIAVLPSWIGSEGARCEVSVGRQIGLPILDAYTMKPIDVPTVPLSEYNGFLLGLCGFARVGKDFAAKGLAVYGWHRVGFADALKADIDPILIKFGVNTSDPSQKEKVRDLYVQHGRTMRSIHPNHWIEALRIPKDAVGAVIADVRYTNECNAILDRGGTVIMIRRPDYEPANREEAESFLAIADEFPNMPIVINNGTQDQLVGKVTEIINWP